MKKILILLMVLLALLFAFVGCTGDKADDETTETTSDIWGDDEWWLTEPSSDNVDNSALDNQNQQNSNDFNNNSNNDYTNNQQIVIRIIEMINGGNIICINSNVGILNLVYKYKFCGLPNGVNIPPKFAAIFCIINVKAIYFSL